MVPFLTSTEWAPVPAAHVGEHIHEIPSHAGQLPSLTLLDVQNESSRCFDHQFLGFVHNPGRRFRTKPRCARRKQDTGPPLDDGRNLRRKIDPNRWSEPPEDENSRRGSSCRVRASKVAQVSQPASQARSISLKHNTKSHATVAACQLESSSF